MSFSLARSRFSSKHHVQIFTEAVTLVGAAPIIRSQAGAAHGSLVDARERTCQTDMKK